MSLKSQNLACDCGIGDTGLLMMHVLICNKNHDLLNCVAEMCIYIRSVMCTLSHTVYSYVCICVFVVQIFDKALDEPSYSSMYAQLCSRLHTYNPNSDINKDKQNTVRMMSCML